MRKGGKWRCGALFDYNACGWVRHQLTLYQHLMLWCVGTDDDDGCVLWVPMMMMLGPGLMAAPHHPSMVLLMTYHIHPLFKKPGVRELCGLVNFFLLLFSFFVFLFCFCSKHLLWATTTFTLLWWCGVFVSIQYQKQNDLVGLKNLT